MHSARRNILSKGRLSVTPPCSASADQPLSTDSKERKNGYAIPSKNLLHSKINQKVNGPLLKAGDSSTTDDSVLGEKIEGKKGPAGAVKDTQESNIIPIQGQRRITGRSSRRGGWIRRKLHHLGAVWSSKMKVTMKARVERGNDDKRS